MKSLKLVFALFPLSTLAQLPLGGGFTQFTPSPDSRIIYVSASSGDDAAAHYYSPSAPQVGADPFQPAGPVAAYRTLAAAITQLRNGYPDWILLKKGDTFTNQSFGVLNLGGRGLNEPLLIGAYGTAAERPRVLTGANSFLQFINGAAAFVAVSGIYAEPHTRSGSDEPVGINILNAPFQYFLVEDCYFNLFDGHLVVQDQTGSEPYSHRNFAARRNILTNAYRLGGGGGGVYMSRIDGILFEENLIDHNGWSSTIPGAPATGFSHNTYFQSNCKNLVFRENIVSRASAVGGGIRCGGYVYNNLFLDNPRNLLLGSFDPAQINWPTEGVSGELAYNVVLDARPELGPGFYDPGNGISLERVRNVSVHHNIIAHFTRASEWSAGIGINMADNVVVENNIVYKWGNNNPSGSAFASGISIGDNLIGLIQVNENDIQMENELGYCVNKAGGFGHTAFNNNRYHNVLPDAQWFSTGSFSSWVSASAEMGAQQTDVLYLDPERNISSYLSAIGQSGGLAELIEWRKEMGKSNWLDDYTAQQVNDYIRQGFGFPTISTKAAADLNAAAFVYPNPSASGLFSIGGKTEGYSGFQVFNTRGQLIFSQNGIAPGDRLDLSSLPGGVYFCIFNGKQKSTTVKAVKN